MRWVLRLVTHLEGVKGKDGEQGCVQVINTLLTCMHFYWECVCVRVRVCWGVGVGDSQIKGVEDSTWFSYTL